MGGGSDPGLRRGGFPECLKNPLKSACVCVCVCVLDTQMWEPGSRSTVPAGPSPCHDSGPADCSLLEQAGDADKETSMDQGSNFYESQGARWVQALTRGSPRKGPPVSLGDWVGRWSPGVGRHCPRHSEELLSFSASPVGKWEGLPAVPPPAPGAVSATSLPAPLQVCQTSG